VGEMFHRRSSKSSWWERLWHRGSRKRRQTFTLWTVKGKVLYWSWRNLGVGITALLCGRYFDPNGGGLVPMLGKREKYNLPDLTKFSDRESFPIHEALFLIRSHDRIMHPPHNRTTFDRLAMLGFLYPTLGILRRLAPPPFHTLLLTEDKSMSPRRR
jgi:hypothetical protein